ncbi:hypothetical protein P152DRAFT_166 [Eremomyces bilateralis CBS 781.70]|uniref:MARVEL domain-containing protein n=1 Tax=Eremomyces bilateralis CBS 781.70 TaxID=1392243 RepID=A0A6G1GFT0_9PEZI|nr:uncharacterized protein P152DRAFT_166 [Eremomyces bilateralis CBS 781.70]KAF1816771.1 hypothetical protein P152DRAFT_166 [Eremomyces bilateralis CBS 781.70]
MEEKSTEQAIVRTPLWVTIVQGFQIFFAVVILGLCGYIIHGVAMDQIVFALVCCLFTFVICAYTMITEKLTGFNSSYNIFAVLALNAFMVVFWLASMGAVAARRATFTVPVNASCYSTGSSINSGRCDIYKRAIVVTQAGLAMISAIAGLSALECILFITVLVYATLEYKRNFYKPSAAAATTPGTAEAGQAVEMKAQNQPLMDPNHPQQAYPPQQTYAQPVLGQVAQPYAPSPQGQPALQQYSPYQQQTQYPTGHTEMPGYSTAQSPPPQQAVSPLPQQYPAGRTEMPGYSTTQSPPPQQAVSPPPQQFTPQSQVEQPYYPPQQQQ